MAFEKQGKQRQLQQKGTAKHTKLSPRQQTCHTGNSKKYEKGHLEHPASQGRKHITAKQVNMPESKQTKTNQTKCHRTQTWADKHTYIHIGYTCGRKAPLRPWIEHDMRMTSGQHPPVIGQDDQKPAEHRTVKGK